MMVHRGSRLLLSAALALGLAMSIPLEVEAADKRQIRYEKTSRQTLSETKMAPPGMSEREIVQGAYLDAHRSPDPELDGSYAHVFNQDTNAPGGNGTHRGFEIDHLKSGEQIFQSFEGTHKIMTKGDGAWEITYQGKSQIIGGTGKYKNARGWIEYTGRITPESFSEQDVGEIEY